MTEKAPNTRKEPWLQRPLSVRSIAILSASVALILSVVGCFSEITLPSCTSNSDCVNAGLCRCLDGYCFRCLETDTSESCDDTSDDACSAAEPTDAQ